MHISLNRTKCFLAVATSAIASSLIAIAPSQAATLSSSRASFKLDNFSISPQEVSTFSNTNTNAVSLTGKGKSQSDAKANANFISDLTNTKNTFATNNSFSEVSGEGKDYFALGEGFAQVNGLSFLVGEGETLSFDFQGLLNLETSIDNPEIENATADGSIFFAIFDQESGETLDFFKVAGNISTPNNQDNFNIESSQNIFFNPNGKSTTTNFGGNQESAQANIGGFYSRKFTQSKTLGLVEFKSTRSRVSVPEPENAYFVFLGGFTLLIVAKRKAKFR
jgi:hypothetical protein